MRAVRALTGGLLTGLAWTLLVPGVLLAAAGAEILTAARRPRPTPVAPGFYAVDAEQLGEYDRRELARLLAQAAHPVPGRMVVDEPVTPTIVR
jgi:hypothetical protein